MIELKQRLKSFRQATGLTQKALAKQLGVTQVHVSRIEKGTTHISKNLEIKILSIIGGSDQYPDIKIELDTDDCWDIASFVLAQNRSGDRILIDKKSFRSRMVLFHCDSPGHDSNSKYMSNYLAVGLGGILGSIFNDLVCTPEFIYSGLDKMVRSTKNFWLGAPSCNIFVFNRENKKIQILNAGMPSIWLTRKGTKEVRNAEDKKWFPLGEKKRNQWPFSQEVILAKGDALFSLSDGLVDEFKEHSTIPLKKHISSISHSLKGDAESIGTKLLVILEKIIKTSTIKDDISFLVVSKK